MRLPDGNGIDLVRHIQQQQTRLPVAVITAYGSMDSAVEALKAGAFDFVSKPVDLHVLRNLVNSVLKLSDDYPKRDRRSRDILLGERAGGGLGRVLEARDDLLAKGIGQLDTNAVRSLQPYHTVHGHGEFHPIVQNPQERDVLEPDQIRPVLAHQVRHGSLR